MAEYKEIELEQQYAVVSIPKNTVTFTICANIYLDGKIQEVRAFYDMNGVKQAVKEAEQGYIPSDAKFVLTDNGKKVAELMDGGMTYEEACRIVDMLAKENE